MHRTVFTAYSFALVVVVGASSFFFFFSRRFFTRPKFFERLVLLAERQKKKQKNGVASIGPFFPLIVTEQFFFNADVAPTVKKFLTIV